MTNNPKISIITVVYNAVKVLEETIISVISQNYSNIEYIIIDGGSHDGTLEIIQKYDSQITHWLSETDKGIYDAMNKAIHLATGIYVNFMNAGDKFASSEILKQVIQQSNVNSDILYGGVETILPNLKKIKPIAEADTLWKGMTICHQAVFSRLELHKKHVFNFEKYPLVADYDFLYAQYFQNKKFQKINMIIVVFNGMGVSGHAGVGLQKAFLKVLKSYHQTLSMKIQLYHVYRFFSQSLYDFLKKYLPQKVYYTFMSFKHKVLKFLS